MTPQADHIFDIFELYWVEHKPQFFLFVWPQMELQSFFPNVAIIKKENKNLVRINFLLPVSFGVEIFSDAPLLIFEIFVPR